MSNRLRTPRELAELLGVSTETVLRWTRRGELPAIKLPGGAIRFRETDLEAWIAEHAIGAGDAARGVSATRNAAHPIEAYGPVPLDSSATPLREHAARTEED
jgi:excisionase family DNA binding protein